jgi:hypothetical protein
VRPPAPLVAPHRVYKKERDFRQVALDACRVFRSGFSVHNARAVINAAFAKIRLPVPGWEGLQKILGEAAEQGRISYGRGQYYFTAAQVRAAPVLDARFVLDGGIHLAAGLSFAPIIAGTLNFPHRRLSMSAHELREAIWHLHQAYGFLDSRDKEDKLRGHLSLLGFVLPVQDWDTVRFLSFDAMNYASEGFDLARNLIDHELQHGSPADAACFALALAAASRALSSAERPQTGEVQGQPGAGRRVRQLENAREAYSWVEKIIGIHESRVAVTPADRIRLSGQHAFFLQQFLRRAKELEWKVDPLWADKALQKSLDLARDVLWPAVVAAYDRDSIKTLHTNFPIEHGWLLQQFDTLLTRPRAEMDAWRSAWCMCATDVHPSVESWVTAISAFPGNARPRDYVRLLKVWEERVTDKKAFAARFRAWILRSTEPAVWHDRPSIYKRRVERVERVRNRLARAARVAAEMTRAREFTDRERAAAIELAEMVDYAEQAAIARHAPSRQTPQPLRFSAPPDPVRRAASGTRPATRRASR